MSNIHSIPEHLKCDYLLLLVGGNPLPNAIAGRLLVKDIKQSKIVLLHSKGEHSTKSIANNLQTWFEKKGMPSDHILLNEVDASDKHDIRRVVEKQMKNATGDIGLHYTGGTKTMAVHAHATVLATVPNAVMSYLDAHSLCMIFDDKVRRYVGINANFNLIFEELFTLHGWNLEKSDPPTQTLTEIADYRDFLGKGALLERMVVQQVASIAATYNLSDIRLNLFARKNDIVIEFDVGFLRGYQLFFLSCSVTNPEPMKEDGTLNEKRRKANRGKAKAKLLEAFVRAKQLGGDEASVALVCLFDGTQSKKLEQELQQTLGGGRVKVFGRKHLLKLSKHLECWIKEQSRYGKEC